MAGPERSGRMTLLALSAAVHLVHGADPEVRPDSATSPQSPLILTNLDAALGLPLAEAQRGYRLKAPVTVTYCHPQWGMLFVLGDTLGTYINIRPETPPLTPGDVVEIEGSIATSRGYAEVTVEHIQPTRQRRGLTPGPWNLEEILSGHASCQWTEMEGRVIAAYVKNGRTLLQLDLGSTNLPVYLLEGDSERARGWMDSRIKVSGVVSVQYDTRGKMMGVALLAQEARQVEVVQRAAVNPLELPLTAIGRVGVPAPGKPAGRVHIQGVLEQVQSNSTARVRDRSASIRVECSFKPEERVDALVEVVGYPVLINGEVVLRDAAVLPLVASMTAGSEMAPEASSSTNGLPLVETARAVHRLSRSEAARGYPVRFEGVVTYSDPGWWSLFIQDGTDGIFVAPLTSQMEVRPGQRVVVSGTTASGDYAPVVTQATFAVLGDAAMPTPARPTLGELLTGQFDCRWVQISGVVQSVSEDNGRARLYVRTREGKVPAVPGPAVSVTEAMGLLDARVTMQGAIGVELNRKGQLVGIWLHVPNLDSVHVDEPPPTDPFAVATQRIADLLLYQPDNDTGVRIKIAGTVTGIMPGGTIGVQDDSGGMLIQGEDPGALQLGDQVEVIGYPTAGDYSATLTDTRVRAVGSGTDVQPTPVTPEAILAGEHASELVRINARLIEDALLRPSGHLILQSGSVVFEARLPASFPSTGAESLGAGSQLAVTGVCHVQGGWGSQPKSFRLLLRQPRDVQILARPGWWNLRRLGWGLAGLGAVGVFALAWNLLLAKKNRQLRESEERTRSILNNVQAGIIVVDATTREVLEANSVALALFDRGREEVVGRGCHGSICPHDRGRCPIADLGHAVDNSERVVVRADGTLVPVLKTVVPITLGGRKVLLESFVDITERKQAQTELERAKLAAEVASEAKSRFLAMMSHEIRTPLNGVTGMLHLLKRDQPSPQQRRWIDMAQNAAETLLRVIGDILDFSKVEAGKLELRPAPTLLHPVIGEAAAAFAYKAADKGLAWNLYVDPAVPRVVEADTDRLAQVLGNLLGNAVKFTDTGSVSLRVTLEAQAADITTLRFAIADTGEGLSPEQQLSLFKPFSQVDNSTTRRHGGTGLGLGICKQLVELMGGTIGVETAVGQGSTFWFKLPLRAATLAPAAPSVRRVPVPEAPGGPAFAAVSRRRVLLAEDNEINQELAREMIEFAGYECECVATGHEAVRAASRGDFALVFMDCMMPELDGYGATRAIRAEESRAAAAGQDRGRLPIIALTANAMTGDRETCLAAGMDDYLSKPLDPESVAQILRRWVTNGRPAPLPDRVELETAAVGSGSLAESVEKRG